MEDKAKVTRRRFASIGTGALAAVGMLSRAEGQQGKVPRSSDHHLPNEQEPGSKNAPLEAENPSSAWAVETDSGTVKPFKYSFSLARKRIESGGWTRQVTARELPISTTIAGVEMRLTAGGVRELHWHVTAEWSIMLYGNARITAVDRDGKSFVSDVSEGDLWLFPPGIPHSIQGLGPDGCKFLLVFNDGNFDEFQTFLITDWLAHTPKEVLAKNFSVPATTFDNIPKKELFIFQTDLPGDLQQEQNEAAEGTGTVPQGFHFKASEIKPTKATRGERSKSSTPKFFL